MLFLIYDNNYTQINCFCLPIRILIFTATKLSIMDVFFQTWPWYISGFLIGMIMLSLIYFGKHFGMSSNLESLCSMSGLGKKISYFDFDWKANKWNLIVVLGAVLGGFVAANYMSDPTNVSINLMTIEQLAVLGIDAPNGKLAPEVLLEIKFLNRLKVF